MILKDNVSACNSLTHVLASKGIRDLFAIYRKGLNMKRGKLWLGLFSVGVLTSSILAAGTRVAWVNEMLINDALHLNGTKISNNKRSAYADEEGNLTDEGYAKMISDSLDFCVKEEEQGAVLLKNNLIYRQLILII